jgi:hypothetical protein
MSEVDDIVFRVGTHRETMKVAFEDYRRLAQPASGEFAWQM